MERVSARKIKTTVFRREANTNTHINWNLHALIQWEVGTMGNGNFKKFTTFYNDYQSRLVSNVISEKQEKRNSCNNATWNMESIVMKQKKNICIFEYIF